MESSADSMYLGGEITKTLAANESPLHGDQTPGQWVKNNLFNSVMNSIITLVLGAATVFLIIKGITWVANEEWEIIRVNLRNFMVGRFPSDELNRLWTAGYILVGTVSIGSAAMAHNAYDDAVEKGLPTNKSSWVDLLRRFAPLLLFVALMASFSRTMPPKLGLLVALGLIVAGRYIGWALPAAIRQRAMFFIGAGILLHLAVLAGTSGLVAMVAGLLAAAFASSELDNRFEGSTSFPPLARTGAAIVIGLVVWFVLRSLDIDGFGWEDWGGLHLTLFVTVVGIASGMPIGILLAIGRRSQLPIIKGFCVMFIEFVRGVPLISLLLFSNIILPLLFPPSAEIPETLTRSMIVIMLFSAAYIAEIVRGGLQAVPKGQTEAAQASGMSPGKIQRLIVMPQALRAVIPAMVGQFISLCKDTSLLAVIGVAEFYQYSAIANSQPDFLGKELQVVTYSIIAIGYWAVCYTMSKESRRLEAKLGVGVR